MLARGGFEIAVFLTERLDLRGGRNCWLDGKPSAASDPMPRSADVVIVGAGIMGAMVAQRLAQNGIGIVVVDQRTPATGATAASTALVMWGADTPLTHLAADVGEAAAIARWRCVFEAVESLNTFVRAHEIDCGWIARPEVYLAGNVLGADELKVGQLRSGSGRTYARLDRCGAQSGRARVVPGGC